MAVAVSINSIEASGDNITVTGFLTFSGSYVTGGETVNLTTATQDATYIGMLPSLISSSVLNADVWSMNGSGLAGANSVAYQFVATKAGTPTTINPASGLKIKVSALNASPSTEHSQASYESQITGDIVAFMVVAVKMI